MPTVTHPTLVAYITRRWRDDGRSAKQIEVEIEQDPDLNKYGFPRERVIQKYIQRARDDLDVDQGRARPSEPPELWTLEHGDGDVILPMLAYYVRTWGAPQLGGFPTWFTKAYAAIVRAVPDIPIAEAVQLARVYRASDANPQADLYEYMAFAPWRSEQDALAYVKAAEQDKLTDWWPNDTPSTHWAIEASEILQDRLTGDRHPAEVHDDAWAARGKASKEGTK